MRASAWVGIIIVALIVIGGIWYYVSSNSSSSYNPNSQEYPMATTTSTSASTTTVSTSSPQAASGAAMSATVTFDGSTFSPAAVTIAQGGTVNFVDTSSSPFWIASDPHPIHNGYDGTSMQQHCASGYSGPAPFDECSHGTSFSFTFAKVGSWGYHDHLEASIKGTVVVVSQ